MRQNKAELIRDLRMSIDVGIYSYVYTRNWFGKLNVKPFKLA